MQNETWKIHIDGSCDAVRCPHCVREKLFANMPKVQMSGADPGLKLKELQAPTEARQKKTAG